MKFSPTFIIALILFITSLKSYGGFQLKYRFQCAVSYEKKIPQKLKVISELKTFTPPSGVKIFFSGGYFSNYEKVENRLDEVHNVGFVKAFIGVFKYNSILSKSVEDFYIEKVKNKILSNQKTQNKITQRKATDLTF